MSSFVSDIHQLNHFILELDQLKGVLRHSRPVGLDRRENTAEHSWQVALFAACLAEYAPSSVLIDRVIKMLLIHDVVEIDAGDKYLYGGQHEDFANELQAAERIFGLLPATLARDFIALWTEFEQRKTADARFAKAIDRTLPVLQNLAAKGQSWREHGVSFSQVVEMNRPISDGFPELWEYIYQQLVDAEAAGYFGSTAK